MVSGLKVFSIGIVVDGHNVKKIADKDSRNNELKRLIEIYPIEHLSQLDGDLSKVDSITYHAKDLMDNDLTSAVHKGKTLSAKWLNISNYNRVTPPMVNKGETVRIYRFEDTDYYYWDTIFLEEDLRQGEYIEEKYRSKEGGWYSKIMDGLNNLFSFSSPNNVPYPFNVYLNSKKGEYGLDMGKDNSVTFTNGGDNLSVTIYDSFEINTDKLTANVNIIELLASTIQLRGEVTSDNEITVVGIPVYKTLVDHETRIGKLEIKAGE